MSSDLKTITEKIEKIELHLKRLTLLLCEELFGLNLVISHDLEDLTLEELLAQLDDETFDLLFPFDEENEGDEDEETKDPLSPWRYIA